MMLCVVGDIRAEDVIAIAGELTPESHGDILERDYGSDEELSADYIIPAAFDPRVGKAVAEAVAEAARKSGVARI